MNGYDAQEAIDNPPRGDGTVSVLDYADGQAKAFRAATAPGIDLPGWAFERPSGADVIVISAPNGKTWIAEPDDRLHMLAAAVMDASPKGGSDVEAWKLLSVGEMIRRGDQILNDDCATWGELVGWEVGLPYNPTLYVPMRRAQATSAEVGP